MPPTRMFEGWLRVCRRGNPVVAEGNRSSSQGGPEMWDSIPLEDLLRRLETTPAGLTAGDAAKRLEARKRQQRFGINIPPAVWLFASQFGSPIPLILIGAATLSLFLQAVMDAVMILTIVWVGAILRFWQESSGASAPAELLVQAAMNAISAELGKRWFHRRWEG